MKRLLALTLFAGMVHVGAASADETTLCNAMITTLPYTISAQGHYCFDRNLSTAITTGNAITINSDFVVLDLNNFKLGGGSAGLGTQAMGVHANDRKNITIRNGNIRGFFGGIDIEGDATTSGGHVVENNVLDGNTAFAVFVAGDGVVLRNNLVSGTGGSTVVASASGLVTGDGFGVVMDNIINDTFSDVGDAYGIFAGGVVDHNVVRVGTAVGNSFGIYGATADTVCRDNSVVGFTLNPYVTCIPVGDNYVP
jgi:hypothetical protein